MLPTGTLICCSGHFWIGSLCLFGFCLPVSSVSNFCPDTGGQRWSLVQVCWFSRAAGREGRCRQISLVCVGSTRSVPATLGLPPLTGACFSRLHCSGSQLLYMEWGLHCMRFQFWGTPQKHGLDWACVLCLPRPEQLRQPGACRAHSPRVRCAFSPPWSQPQFPRAPVGCVCLMSTLGSWPLATTLLAEVDHPESQQVFG